jgi:hypothetical protein
MRKQNFVLVIAMTLLVALTAFAAGARAASNGVPIPGTVCIEHQVTASDDSNLPFGTTWTNSVTFTQQSPGVYRASGLMTNFLGTGYPAFCEGAGQVNGSELISAMTCTFGGPATLTAATATNPPWISATNYQCNLTFAKGKVSMPGAFWETYSLTYQAGPTSTKATVPTPFGYVSHSAYGVYNTVTNCK